MTDRLRTPRTLLIPDPVWQAYDQMAADIALTHHENWDGTGYPGRVDYHNAYFEIRNIEVEGVIRTGEVWHAPALESDPDGKPKRLKGEEIPLSARIFAVVDVFDALTSDRPYRTAWEKEKALAYIREQSGRHFFPEAVKVFCEMAEN